MAADSVGQIGLDLVVNKGEFESQMKGLQGLAAKAGKTLAAAFAVKKLVDFGKSCIALGSDLAEVQNVVDVTFPSMSKQIDKFAQNAAKSFGLSETMAKKFSGTFGAMSKAFGFGERQAYEMATALTGLAGDVASFYNLSQDEAYTKLKSVFTGETESLKELGVVMTQTALDQYALANGFGKTTSAMSEMEKVALRYRFVQDQLSLAAGDFIRTSDGWANQVRILQLQFDSLRATIGQGLIAALSPVIRTLNILIGRILTAANALKAFFSLLGGGGSKAQGMTAGTDAIAKSADKATGALGGTGGAAKKAAKDIKSATSGIDELNIIQTPDAASGGSGSEGEASGGGYAAEDFDMGNLPEESSAVDSRMAAIVSRFQELKELFSDGFWDAFGDTSVFDSIKGNIDSIRQSLQEIFTAPEVQTAANDFANTVAYSMGQISGSMFGIGTSIADNLTGAIAKYLEQNTERIKGYICTMFDIGGNTEELAGNFAKTLNDIFGVLRGDTFQQIGADIIDIFSTAFMTVTLLTEKFGADFMSLLLQPVIDNKDKIVDTLNGLSIPIEQVFGMAADATQMFGDTLLRIYDSAIHPVFGSLQKGIAEVLGKLLDAFNKYILPVLQNAADRLTSFKDSVLPPLLGKFEEVFGKASEVIRTLWENVLVPFISWFIENIAPIIAQNLQVCVDYFFAFLESCSQVISAVLDVLNGLMDFLMGVFTGDWKRAWEGIKEIFSGLWRAMVALAKTLLNALAVFIRGSLIGIQSVWGLIWGQIKKFFESVWNAIKEACHRILAAIYYFIVDKMHSIKNGISTALESIKTGWNNIWEGLKTSTIQIFEGIWNGIKGIINRILSGVEVMANGVVNAINGMIEALNGLSFDIPDWVPGIGGESFGLNIPTIPTVSIPRLAQGGFVRANTPQLAMIGDNRHHGEIVAPEDKMQDMVNRAVALASQEASLSEQYLSIMIDLLKRIIDLIGAMDLTVNIDIREIKKRLAELDSRSGYSLRAT